MPPQDQNLNYKVRLDTNDLASQLQQVRAQIDQAVGSIAFNSTAVASQPSQFAFPVQQYLQNAGISAQNDMQSLATSVQMGARHVANMNDAAQLGFQKFNNDVQTALLSQGTPLINSAAGGYYPDPSKRGFTSNMAGTLLGWGYDPQYSITPGEFGRLSNYQAASQVVSAGLKTGGSLAGGWIGQALIPIPIVGGAIGSFLGERAGGFLNDAAEATILRDFTYGNKIKENAWNTSWRFLGGRFTRAQAGQIGENLATAQRSDALLGYDVTATDVSRVMSEFTEMGGFDTTRSAAEYQTRAKAMIENHRKIMQTLKVTETEALAVIKEFNLQSPNADLNFLTNKTAISAYASGLTGREMLQFSNQAAEIVRGTGISMTSAFMGSMDTMELVRRGMQSGVISPELIRQYGGAENYALNVTRIGYEFGMSRQGMTDLAAASERGGFGNMIGLNPIERLGSAAKYLTKYGIKGMLENIGTAEQRVSGVPAALLTAEKFANIAGEVGLLHPGERISAAEVIGYAKEKYGMSANEAALGWNTAIGGDTRNLQNDRATAIQTAFDQTQSATAILRDRIKNKVTDAIQDNKIALGLKAGTSLIEGISNSIQDAQATRIGVRTYRMENIAKRFAGAGWKNVSQGTLNSVLSEIDDWQKFGAAPKAIDAAYKALQLGNVLSSEEALKNYALIRAAAGDKIEKLSDLQKIADSASTTPIITVQTDKATPDVNSAEIMETTLPGITGWFAGQIGSLMRTQDAAVLKNYNDAKRAIPAAIPELNQIRDKLRAMGGADIQSVMLQKDPMLGINRMGAETAANGAVASVELLSIAKTTGINVNIASNSAYKYDEKIK